MRLSAWALGILAAPYTGPGQYRIWRNATRTLLSAWRNFRYIRAGEALRAVRWYPRKIVPLGIQNMDVGGRIIASRKSRQDQFAHFDLTAWQRGNRGNLAAAGNTYGKASKKGILMALELGNFVEGN